MRSHAYETNDADLLAWRTGVVLSRVCRPPPPSGESGSPAVGPAGHDHHESVHRHLAVTSTRPRSGKFWESVIGKCVFLNDFDARRRSVIQ